ncbi:MAG: hypothetical protein D6785_06570, partial [Planctomycetota bacterium]
MNLCFSKRTQIFLSTFFFLFATFILFPQILFGKKNEGKPDYQTKYFRFYHSPEKAHEMAPYFERFRKEYYKLLPKWVRQAPQISIYFTQEKVFLSHNFQEVFQNCSSQEGAILESKKIILSLKAPTWKIYQKGFHLLSHIYLGYSLGKNIPLWLNEGLAEFCGGSLVQNFQNLLAFGLPRYSYLLYLLKIRDRKGLPLIEDILELSYSRFFLKNFFLLHRSFSWLLVHYL